MKTERIILGLREDRCRMGGYTLETVEVEYNEDGTIKSYSNDGFEFLTQDYIDERNDVSYAESEEDIWKEAVRTGYTDLGLEEWYEDLIDNQYDGLFPFDDSSYRDEVEEAWKNLTDKQRRDIEEFVGDKDVDFVTFNWVHSLSLGNPSEQAWVVLFDEDLLNKIIEKDKPYFEPKICPMCGKEVERHEPMYYSYAIDGKPLCGNCNAEMEKKQELKERNEKCQFIIDYFNRLAESMKEPIIEDVVREFLEDADEYTISRIVDDIKGE